MSETILSVRDLHISFGGVKAADGVDLEVRRDDDYIKRLLAAEEVFWKRFAPLVTTVRPEGFGCSGMS